MLWREYSAAMFIAIAAWLIAITWKTTAFQVETGGRIAIAYWI